MSLAKPTQSLTQFDVIRSDRFEHLLELKDGTYRIAASAEDPSAQSDDTYRVDWYVVLETSNWGVRAIELVNGDIYTDSRVIAFTTAEVAEVEVIGRAQVAGTVEEDRDEDISVKVTLAEGAARDIANRYYFMACEGDQAAFMIVEKKFYDNNGHMSDMERGEELEDVFPAGFANASEAEFHYYEKGVYESEVSDEVKEKARQLLLAAGFAELSQDDVVDQLST